MDACPKCGVNRRYVGVAFPVRHLCKCEARVCGSCDTAAVFVEFQNPIKAGEPKLPVKSNQHARFTCKGHAPDDLPEEPIGEEPSAKKRRTGRPHIDPAWSDVSSRAPVGAMSTMAIVCSACKLRHTPRQRVMWNGTYSYCPVAICNSAMFVEED